MTEPSGVNAATGLFISGLSQDIVYTSPPSQSSN